VIIAPVGYDEQRLLCVVCSLHLAETQVNSIEQRRLTFCRGKHQAVLQLLDARGE
jgi:hypothetical protein